MTSPLVLVAACVAIGGAIAVSARIPRAAILGLVVVLAGSPFVTDPAPSVTATAARVVAAVLAGYVLWIAVRGPVVPIRGSRAGLPGAVAIGIAVFAAGWLAADAVELTLGAGGAEGPGGGTVAALAGGSPVARGGLAAACALAVLAAAPVLMARDALRLAIGLLLLLSAAGLAGTALGQPGDAATVAMAVLTAATGIAGAVLVRRSRARNGELILRDPPAHEPGARVRAHDEAHPSRPPR